MRQVVAFTTVVRTRRGRISTSCRFTLSPRVSLFSPPLRCFCCMCCALKRSKRLILSHGARQWNLRHADLAGEAVGGLIPKQPLTE